MSIVFWECDRGTPPPLPPAPLETASPMPKGSSNGFADTQWGRQRQYGSCWVLREGHGPSGTSGGRTCGAGGRRFVWRRHGRRVMDHCI